MVDQEIGNQMVESSVLGNIGLALMIENEHNNALEYLMVAIQIADEISYPIVQNEERWGLSQTYLFQNDFANARATIEAALEYDVPNNNHNASALQGIIALRQGDEVAARGAFLRAIGQADEILSKTPDYYSALDAKGLALSGLAVVSGQLTAQPSTANNQPPTDYRQQAIETFQKARKIAPHAGIVKSVLRLFDELAKCETKGTLKDVRKAAEGK